MNVTNNLTGAIYRAPAAIAVAPVDPSAPAASVEAQSKTKGPLFSGGLVNWGALMTPETMGALFALDANGEVQFGDNTAPVLNKGQSNDTPEEELLSQHVRAQHLQDVGADMGYAPSITDEQKQFFHSLTGYNLVVEGALYSVRDDQGNMVPDTAGKDGRSSPVWQLASDMVANGLQPDAEQQPIDADWYKAWSDRMAGAGTTLPPAWAANAGAYFDAALDALFADDKARAAKRVEARQDGQDPLATAANAAETGNAAAPVLQT